MGITQKLQKTTNPRLNLQEQDQEIVEILDEAWILGLNPSILWRKLKESDSLSVSLSKNKF